MSTLRNTPKPERRGRDPLGKQAVFSVPEEIIDLAAIETPFDMAPVHDTHESHAGPLAADVAEAAARAAADPAAPPPEPLPHGPLALECSSCGTTTRVNVLDFALAHLPVGIWLPIPGWRFNRYATCPSCKKLTWLRAHLAR